MKERGFNRKLQHALDLQGRGELEKAEDILRNLIDDYPKNFAVYNYLGTVLRMRQEFDEAIEYYRKALELNPKYFEAYYNLALTLQAKGNNEESILYYEKAIDLNPHFAGSYHNLGKALQLKDNLDEAIVYYEKAIGLNPNFASYYNLGEIYHKKGCYHEAIENLKRANQISGNNELVYAKLGSVYYEMGYLDDAIEYYKKALQIMTNFPAAYNNLGNVFREKGLFQEALDCYQAVETLTQNFIEAKLNKGITLMELGDTQAAVKVFETILENNPDYILAGWAKCMAHLQVIYEDLSHIENARAQYRRELQKLREQICFKDANYTRDAYEAVGNLQPFFLACQGENDRELQRSYGDLVCKIIAEKYPEITDKSFILSESLQEPIRIGIVSAHFYHHSVWKIPLRGWIENIDKNRFHIYGYYTGRRKDSITDTARNQCYRFIEDIHNLEKLFKTIQEDNLHVLMYPEIGMDPITLRLAALRLAPVQCVSLGHPDTTGLPTIDYYLSSELMEPYDANEHYTEQLIRLPNLGFYYEPSVPHDIEMKREELGLPENSVLYLCSHALFTYLPQYDELYPRIARNIEDCTFVFISSQKGNMLTNRFYSRLKKAFTKFGLKASDFVVILPRLDQLKYYALNCLCDVFLDTPGWSANNSTFEAIACNVPVITLPGKLMRQRHAAAILTMMGMKDTIASSLDEYIELAVHLGKDAEWRKYESEKIAKIKHSIYRDKRCITALEDFFERVLSKKTRKP